MDANILAGRATRFWLEASRTYPTRSLELSLFRAAEEYGHITDLSLIAAILDQTPQIKGRFEVLNRDKIRAYLKSPSQQIRSIEQSSTSNFPFLESNWSLPEKLDVTQDFYHPGEDFRADPIIEWRSGKKDWEKRRSVDDITIGTSSHWLGSVTLHMKRHGYHRRGSHPIMRYTRRVGGTHTSLIADLKLLTAAVSRTDYYTHAHESLILIPAEGGVRVRPLSYLTSASFREDATRLPVTASSIEATSPLFGFSINEIEELEDLINSSASAELDLQRFFERNPKMLLGLDYERLVAQPILKREEESNLIPDFILMPHERAYTQPRIIDLKRPQVNIFRRTTNRPGYLASVHEARDQLLEYQHYFSSKTRAKEMETLLGGEVFLPQICVVIGRSSSFGDNYERQQARASVPDLEVVTYDDIVSRSRRLLEA